MISILVKNEGTTPTAGPSVSPSTVVTATPLSPSPTVTAQQTPSETPSETASPSPSVSPTKTEEPANPSTPQTGVGGGTFGLVLVGIAGGAALWIRRAARG